MKQTDIDLETIMAEIKTSAPIFEVEPLDINIAKIQFELNKRLELEMPEYGEFLPIIEKYDYKGSYYNFSELCVKCSQVTDVATEDMRTLDLIIKDKKNTNEYICNIAKGNKKEIISALNNRNFLKVCKKVALKHII